MVDALKEAHRILRPRGILVDARPDSRVFAHAEHQVGNGEYRPAGLIATAPVEHINDATSDRAGATAVRGRGFRSLRASRFWHPGLFEDAPGSPTNSGDHR